MYIYVNMYMPTISYVNKYIYTFVYVYIHMYIYMYVPTIYEYVYILYVNMHIYVNMHMPTQGESNRASERVGERRWLDGKRGRCEGREEGREGGRKERMSGEGEGGRRRGG